MSTTALTDPQFIDLIGELKAELYTIEWNGPAGPRRTALATLTLLDKITDQRFGTYCDCADPECPWGQ